MGINMHQPYRCTPSHGFEDRVSDGVITAGGQRRNTGVHDLMKIRFDIAESFIKMVAVLDRHIPNIGDFAQR